MGEPRTTVGMGEITPADMMVTEEQRAAALQQFMQGNPFGGPTRQEQIGLTTDNPDNFLNRPPDPTIEQQAAESERKLAELMAPVANANELERELGEWKKKYGDRENEFGELRRKSQELEETLTLLMAQQSAPQVPVSPYSQQNFSTPYQPNYSAPRQRMFEGKEANDVVTAGDVEQAALETFGPAFGQMAQQLQAQQAELAHLRKQSFDNAKRSAGISALDELKAKAKYPVLASMPDTPDKIVLMQSLMGLGKSAETPAPQPQPQAPAPARDIVRRATHSESNKGVSGEPVTNPNAAFQAEMQAAQAQPFHLRAAAMKKVMDKYGVPQVNTFGMGNRFRV